MAGDIRGSYDKLRTSQGDRGISGSPYDTTGNVHYQPGFVMKRDAETGKFVAELTNPRTLWSSSELNPEHLRGQNIDSYIDGAHNIVYQLPNGAFAKLGFYDRSSIPPSNKKLSLAEIQQDRRDLIANRDPEAPKLPIMQIQPFTNFLLGKSFPSMYGYRSVVFPNDRDTTYGFYLELSKNAIRPPETFQGPLDAEYIDANPDNVNFLYTALAEASKSRGIEFLDLEISDKVDVSQIATRIKYALFLAQRNKYRINAKFTVERSPLLTARVNGYPMMVIAENGMNLKFYEMAQEGGIDLGDSLFMPVTHWNFSNIRDPGDSEMATIVYQPTSRMNSLDEVARNPSFGLLEVVIMEGANLKDAEFEFIKTQEEKPLDYAGKGEDTVRETTIFRRVGGEPSFTAGRTTIGEVKKTRIETTRASFSGVLFRDTVCLVHEDMQSNPAAYLSVESH